MNDFYRLSAAITWMRFPLILFVILLHGYSVVQLQGLHPTYFSSIYPFALWLGETGVPGFLFISGFLFFLSKKSYSAKLQSRFHTLLIPYLIWNGLLLVVYLLLYVLGHPQEINDRSIADYEAIDYVRLFWDRGTFDNGNFVPILCPFWYIRNLILLSLLSPVVWFMVRYLREVFLVVIAIWWILTPHNAFVAQSMLFFSLGAYFSIHQHNPLQVFTRQRTFFFSLFLLLGLADMLSHSVYATPVNLQIHRLALLANLPILFLVADHFASRQHNHTLLSSSVFIVFSIHYPIIVVLRKLCVNLFSAMPDVTQILLYFGCFALTVLMSLLFYVILQKVSPRLTNILAGNRT